MLKLLLLLTVLCAVRPGWSQTPLSGSLLDLKNGSGSLKNVAQNVQNSLNAPLSGWQDVQEAFCVSLRGISCSQLNKYEAAPLPAQLYSSVDGTVTCIVGNMMSKGHLTAAAFILKHTGEHFSGVTSRVILSNVGATSESLPSVRRDRLRLLISGPETGANRSPISFVVEDIATNGTRELLRETHLLEGSVKYDGGVLLVTNTYVPIDLKKGQFATRMRKFALGNKSAREINSDVPLSTSW